MKILVTGGAGFLGSHVCEYMLENKHEVTSIDDRSMGVDFLPKGVLDIKSSLTKTKPNIEVDLVIHCAARADVAQNWVNAAERQRLTESNILGTERLLELTRGTPMIFISTCAVYGDSSDCDESQAYPATSPYAASKLAGEAMAQAYAFARDKACHILRLSCLVGPRYHHGHIADFVAMAKAGAVTPKSDGFSKKSAVHVLDVVDAIGAMARGDIPPGIYNAATGVWSPRDTIRIMGVDGITTWPENKTHGWIGDPFAVASGGRLRSMGWIPTRGVENGVRGSLSGLGHK